MVTKSSHSLTLRPCTGFVQLLKLIKPVQFFNMHNTVTKAFNIFPLCYASTISDYLQTRNNFKKPKVILENIKKEN